MKNYLYRKLIPLILCLAVIASLLTSCGSKPVISSSPSKNSSEEQQDFDTYTDKLFRQEVTGNTINLHYTLSDPASYGIKNHSISLGSLSKESNAASTAQLENMSAALAKFDYDALTTRQQLTYDVLSSFYTEELNASSFYYYNEPLRPTTGTHSELPILLAEYAFYRPSDVTDYLSLLSCIEDSFQSIIAFEEEKSKEGLFMSDFAAETVIASCENFTKNPEENYLITTFDSRIDAMTDLSDEKKETYKQQNRSLVLNAVIPSYENLAAALTKLKDTGSNQGGLCNFSNGTSYYEYLVRTNTGSDKDIPTLQKLTEQKRAEDISALHTILAENPELINADETIPNMSDDPTAILETLQKNMLEDFSPAANTSFEVNYVDSSLEDTLAPAFYLTAPLDNISHNVIYINKGNHYSGIQLFTTLAHEGYPGHLYQTTGSYQAGLEPIRALLNYPGYVEGWATYVEMLSYHYAGLEENLAEMMMRNQSALLSLYATIDMGIHYDGWTLADTTQFLTTYGISDSGVIKNIYELVVEEPSHYLKYYIGYLEFLELKKYAKEELADTYSDRAFHQAIIRIGPAPFSILKDYLTDFIEVTDTHPAY